MFWLFWKQYLDELNQMMAAPAASGETAASPAEKPASEPASDPSEPISPAERYRMLTAYGEQVLCVLSAEHGCVYLSDNWEKISGLAASSVAGPKFYSRLKDASRAQVRALFKDYPYPREEIGMRMRCQIKHGDGKWIWYQVTVASSKQTENGDLQFICILLNINEDLEAQTVLQKARLDAELALRSRSEFLANMSHDLRTPLNAVIGFAQIMAGEMFGKIPNPQYHEYLRHIQESGYELLAKIDDLLQISNFDTGRVSLSLEDTDVVGLVQRSVEAHSYQAFAAQVTIVQEVAADPRLLHVDRLKLQQSLSHLIANALKSCRAGGTVTVTARPGTSGSAELLVRDNGCGMNEDKLGRIRDALGNENAWHARNISGIGVGLALAKEFVALHQGTLELTSAPGQGTEVLIRLPRQCVVHQPAAKPQPKQELLPQHAYH
jgi:PAS domain S-box-containing protein